MMETFETRLIAKEKEKNVGFIISFEIAIT
jgi:hypothetical protein